MKLFEEKVEKKESVENQRFRVNPIEGFPELVWKGKKPYSDTRFFPAQLKERYGEEKDGWFNKIFWGDNLQVMAHLLREYRGKIKLIYIDPPFDSKADYKKTIKLRGETIKNDQNTFEEKQYSDIWNNGEYLQFMYERLILLRELLSDDGSIYLHCDWHKSHHLRCLMDEVFGAREENFQNEIIWCYRGMAVSTSHYVRRHDNILFYTKSSNFTFNWEEIAEPLEETTMKKYKYSDENGRKFRLHGRNITGSPIQNKSDIELKWLETNPELCRIDYLDEKKGAKPRDWFVMDYINIMSNERENYPTQKPEALLERIIKASSNPGDLVFDCFMGSGTTQAVAMKLGRKFIGTDINMGAIQTTTKRLLKIVEENRDNEELYTGFEYYHVNNYDFFRNPIQAKEILLEAYEIEKFDNSNIFDGQKEGRMIKIMPTNRITTKGDLESFISNLNYKVYEQRRAENPLKPVENITLICMGHESDLKASFEEKVKPYKIDLKVVDVLKDRMDINFERDSEADIEIQGNKLVINSFYPRTLLDKLGEEAGNIEDWRVLVESVLIDWNYDGAVLEPSILDTPDKKSLVAGEYEIPEDYGTIRVKITDLLSNSLEMEVKNG
ncbi:site-specific DNA-methyltransferase [Fusobacterium mortiferum]|uniref:Site-specific DNA-methyltransferase n=1 Tax=Fusobacterium mortiferum TaxID=850 RepID=A0ABS2G4I2_FUSMR|nr:site-specific DNA-methyltransferase [Fusobacterium mortiferum]MBM6875807.1 site-specific DNA-methyltransferase [Fusobacterium mortiferum]